MNLATMGSACWTVARRSYVALLLRERENARLLNTFVFVDFIVKEFLDTHRAQSDLGELFQGGSCGICEMHC